MKADDLGLEMQVSVFAVRACPAPEQMKRILAGLVQCIGMSTGGLEAQAWAYPFQGMGGEGETVVQPLMESLSAGIRPGLVAGDSWREHGGCYVIIASCRPYSVQHVAQYLGQEAGLVVGFGAAPVVSLAPRKERRGWCGGGG